MTVPKAVLVAALLLAAAAAAQTLHDRNIYNYTLFSVDLYDYNEDIYKYALHSVGPYDYEPWRTRHPYMLWLRRMPCL